ETHLHRGQTVYTSSALAAAQLGNLVIVGEPASIDRLIDRAVDPPPAGADPQDIYGDVFLRSDLSEIRDSQGPRTAADALLRQLAQVTARANVWDSVALSIEGKPQA